MFQIIFDSLFMAAVCVFPMFLVSLAVNTAKSKTKTAKERAIEKGHVVTATLIKTGDSYVDIPTAVSTGPQRRGVYEYSYKGKRYKYTLWAWDPPARLTLYFLDNPRNATVEEALNDSKVAHTWIRNYFIVAVILYFIRSA